MKTTLSSDIFEWDSCLSELKRLVFSSKNQINILLNTCRILKELKQCFYSTFDASESKCLATVLMDTSADVNLVWLDLCTNQNDASMKIINFSLKSWMLELKRNCGRDVVLNHGITILKYLISHHQKSTDEIAMNLLLQLMNLNESSLEWKVVLTFVFFENGGRNTFDRVIQELQTDFKKKQYIYSLIADLVELSSYTLVCRILEYTTRIKVSSESYN